MTKRERDTLMGKAFLLQGAFFGRTGRMFPGPVSEVYRIAGRLDLTEASLNAAVHEMIMAW